MNIGVSFFMAFFVSEKNSLTYFLKSLQNLSTDDDLVLNKKKKIN